MKKIKLFEEFIAEVRTNPTSGTKAGWITSLEDRKYELKKPVKGVKIGSFTNQTLPKGTIIHNLPGGVFAMHPELEDKFKLTYGSQVPRWNYTFGVLVTSLPETLEAIEKNGKVLESQNISEKREDVGKYNTVKKVIAKLGRRPSEQELAQFITDNYYDVTEVERGEDDPSANDKIADLVAFYKFDIDDWQIAWFDAQNESVVNEEAVEVTPDSKVVVDDYLLDDAETEIKSAEIIGAIVSANSEDEFLDYFYKEYGNGAFTESDISKLIAYYQDYREEVNAAETEAEEEAEGGDEKDPLADLGI
jgi:hypothetical protein